MIGLAGSLLDDEALHDLLQRLTVLAKHVVSDSQAASITVAQNGRYRTTNSTGPDALAIDDAQYDEGDGPCLEATRTGHQLRYSLGERQDAWNKFDAAAAEAGVGGVLSTPLWAGNGDSIGALNVYVRQGGTPEPGDDRSTQLIGEHAGILVGRALDLMSSNELNDQLRQAVATREIIGAAKGILMESQKCTRDEAFDILRRASQRENRKLRDIAEELVVRVESRARRRSEQT